MCTCVKAKVLYIKVIFIRNILLYCSVSWGFELESIIDAKKVHIFFVMHRAI
jgi:hypothetical protein